MRNEPRVLCRRAHIALRVGLVVGPLEVEGAGQPHPSNEALGGGSFGGDASGGGPNSAPPAADAAATGSGDSTSLLHSPDAGHSCLGSAAPGLLRSLGAPAFGPESVSALASRALDALGGNGGEELGAVLDALPSSLSNLSASALRSIDGNRGLAAMASRALQASAGARSSLDPVAAAATLLATTLRSRSATVLAARAPAPTVAAPINRPRQRSGMWARCVAARATRCHLTLTPSLPGLLSHATTLLAAPPSAALWMPPPPSPPPPAEGERCANGAEGCTRWIEVAPQIFFARFSSAQLSRDADPSRRGELGVWETRRRGGSGGAGEWLNRRCEVELRPDSTVLLPCG